MTGRRVTARARETIIERAKGYCEYCQSPAEFATQSFAIEHVIPVSRGGTTTLDNLAFACPGCNGHKYNKTEDKDPVDKKMAALFNPRHQTWGDHFRWSADFTRIVGMTPTGRATVQALNMNRQGVANLRAALFALGRHPPA